MRNIIIAAFIIALIFTFNAGCGAGGAGGGGNSLSGTVPLQVVWSRDGDTAAGAQVSYYIIEVYDSQTSTTPVVPAVRLAYPANRVNIENVPLGTKIIRVGAFDAAGNQTAYGSATMNVLSGTNPVASITMSNGPAIWTYIYPNRVLQQVASNPNIESDSVFSCVTSYGRLNDVGFMVTIPGGISVSMGDLGPGGNIAARNYFYGSTPAALGFQNLWGRGTGSYFEAQTGIYSGGVTGDYIIDSSDGRSSILSYPYPMPKSIEISTPAPGSTVNLTQPINVSWQDRDPSIVGPGYRYLVEAGHTILSSSGLPIDDYYWSSVDLTGLDPNDPQTLYRLIQSLQDTTTAQIPAGVFPEGMHDIYIKVTGYPTAWCSVNAYRGAVNPYANIGKAVLPYTVATLSINPEGGFSFQILPATSLPEYRVNAAGAATANYVYLMNGYIDAGQTHGSGTADRKVYYAPRNPDGSIGSWTETTLMPNSLGGASGTQYNGHLYVAGGATNNGPSWPGYVFYATPQSDGTIPSWSQAASIPGGGGSHPELYAYNGYLYYSGGWAFGYKNTCYRAPINPDGSPGSWTACTNLPVAIRSERMIGNNNYMYIIGGLTESGETAAVYYTTVDPETGALGAWVPTEPLPEARQWHTAGIIGGKLVVLGGSSSNKTFYTSFNGDGTLASWAEGPTLPIAMNPDNQASQAAPNDTLYLPGDLTYNSTAVYYAK